MNWEANIERCDAMTAAATFWACPVEVLGLVPGNAEWNISEEFSTGLSAGTDVGQDIEELTLAETDIAEALRTPVIDDPQPVAAGVSSVLGESGREV
ncbi:hypothetical protein [Mycolicibacterium alvei]|uniref:Uncharacterized protein n=1 Tax=Mycolicibacterium alvei TaxID=67081 RepID=A0A6N4V3T0_9MYCO|nr:hypothetical protein [Mycolicibacterium alvei]MCV7003620.1 hypothetical protein [Mycolicibacterium alvei]BBX30422.1 hypothetical protein MALV_55470 [Mycolicibacterium alvei]